MDPVTHAALGAVAGMTLQRSRLGAGALAGAAGALLPDADVFIRSGTDPLLVVEFHRQFSHSLAAAPAGALLTAGVLWLFMRRTASFSTLYWPAMAGFLSAILLDACTSYGTQLGWPFTDRRVALAIVSVVDPVPTLALLTGLVLALWRQRVSRADAALVCLVAYLGIGWLQHERAAHWAGVVAEGRGHASAEVLVKPTIGNLVLWRSIYLHDGRYHVDALRPGLQGGALHYPGESVPAAPNAPTAHGLPPASVQARDLDRFATLSEGFIAMHPEDPHIVGDVRYAMLPTSARPLWGIGLDPSDPDRHVRFLTFRRTDAQMRAAFVDMLLGRDRQDVRRLP